jgi:dynein heavy chain
MEMLKL